jgi:hypothetical protein
MDSNHKFFNLFKYRHLLDKIYKFINISSRKNLKSRFYCLMESANCSQSNSIHPKKLVHHTMDQYILS